MFFVSSWLFMSSMKSTRRLCINSQLGCNLSRLRDTDNKVFVVSTCSRGIGFEFAKQLLERSADSCKVIGICRKPNENVEKLSSAWPEKFAVFRADLQDANSIYAVSQEIKQHFSKVDLLLNVAAILGDGTKTPGPERSIGNISSDWLKQSFEINLFGHVIVTKELLPLLKNGKNNERIGKVVNISARVGSIEDNHLGGWYSYRMTKAALNMFTKTASIELKRYNCIVLSLHPGTTDTDLSIPFQKNVKPEKLFTVKYSVEHMLDVIWDKNLTDTGKFFAYDGTEIPY